MKFIFILLFTLVLSNFVFTQNVKELPPKEFSESDGLPERTNLKQDSIIICGGGVQPSFHGGEQAMLKFIVENYRIPSDTTNQLISGKIYVEFEIIEDGSVRNVIVKKGLTKALNKEAVRVVSIMPKWDPGTDLRGKVIKQKYILPITININ